MSDTKFTKGEWLARASESPFSHGFIYIDGGGFDVSDSPDCVANAHLIASAPDMYKEIENDIAYFECLLIDAETLGEERAVQHKIDSKNELLKKARGE